MKDFTELVDLAAERLGGAAVVANDDFFAPKENLVKSATPIFIDGKYTDRGKWMDGWESRRRRTPGHDWCIVRLGVPGVVRGVVVDTAFFRGNFPEYCSIDACTVHGNADAEVLQSSAVRWFELLPKSRLEGDKKNLFAIAREQLVTHLRLNIFPDGGVARLRVHGEVMPDLRWMGKPGAEVDLASVENGGLVAAASDMFFGSRHNLIMPGRGVNMGDGWETKRSRRPLDTDDWCVLALAAEGTITRVEVDTAHFKGNYPESCALQVGHREPGDERTQATEWIDVLPRTKLQPDTRHVFVSELLPHPPSNLARLRIFPDGGVSRLRLWGTVTDAWRERLGVKRLSYLAHDDAARELLACCGSNAWAKQMTAARPFASLAALKDAAAKVWASLTPDDWLEAFRAHPRIGEKKADRFSAQEQSGASGAAKETLDALAEANRAYEAKFGHIYIVCATGKSADEMLAIAKRRLDHDAKTELHIAADEQRKITELRLEKLVRGTR